MSGPITDETRAASGEICTLAAEQRTSLAEQQRRRYGLNIATHPPVAHDVWRLVQKARLAASLELRDDTPIESLSAEEAHRHYNDSCRLAAQMLASGWSPGEPVRGGKASS